MNRIISYELLLSLFYQPHMSHALADPRMMMCSSPSRGRMPMRTQQWPLEMSVTGTERTLTEESQTGPTGTHLQVGVATYIPVEN